MGTSTLLFEKGVKYAPIATPPYFWLRFTTPGWFVFVYPSCAHQGYYPYNLVVSTKQNTKGIVFHVWQDFLCETYTNIVEQACSTPASWNKLIFYRCNLNIKTNSLLKHQIRQYAPSFYFIHTLNSIYSILFHFTIL